jgi:hypothetical protein
MFHSRNPMGEQSMAAIRQIRPMSHLATEMDSMQWDAIHFATTPTAT